MNLLKSFLVLILIYMVSFCAFAIEGYDSDTGDRLDIQEGLEGQDEGEIDYYDYKDSAYHHGTINSDLGEGEGPVDVYDAETESSRKIDTN